MQYWPGKVSTRTKSQLASAPRSADRHEPHDLTHSSWDINRPFQTTAQVALAYYEIRKAGGFTTGGRNRNASSAESARSAENLARPCPGDGLPARGAQGSGRHARGTAHLEAIAPNDTRMGQRGGKAPSKPHARGCHARVMIAATQPKPSPANRSAREPRNRSYKQRPAWSNCRSPGGPRGPPPFPAERHQPSRAPHLPPSPDRINPRTPARKSARETCG